MSMGRPVSNLYRKAAWIAWAIFAVVIAFVVIRSIVIDQERSVTPAYQSAVQHWFAAEPLYNMQGHGFLYFPQAALTFAPWYILPHGVSELLWRFSMLAVLAASVSRLNRLLEGDGRSLLAISVSTIVLAWGCARNGQATLMITGLTIFAMADVSERRWWRAAILLALAFAFKPLVLVPILLVGAIYPQMSWRLLASMLFVGLFPFLTQRPDYVISQYLACMQSMEVTFEVGESEKWAQLFGMLQVAGIDLPGSVRTIIRLSAALATFVWCVKASQSLTPRRTAFYILALSTCYLMLFNSRTEGNTYAMVGPVYGALLAEAAFRANNRIARNWLILAVTLSVANYELAVLISPRPDAIWICPLVCVGVSYYLILEVTREISDARLEQAAGSVVSGKNAAGQRAAA